MSAADEFKKEVQSSIDAMGGNLEFCNQSMQWLTASQGFRYSYNFSWLGRPIIQYPQDIVAVQELIWSVKPDLVIETGIAHGGSLILSASLLAMLDVCDASLAGRSFDPHKGKRKVLGIDIDIRSHNRAAIEAHPLAGYVDMIQGSSVDDAVAKAVREKASAASRIMVFLDSNHTHQHVLDELELYAPLVSSGSYCVVFDTIVEHLPKSAFMDRPWGPGNNPMTAVDQFLKKHPEFEIDKAMDSKLQISVAPRGYLRRRAS